MITNYHAIREVAKLIDEAIDTTIDALHERRVEHEPAFTDRMLGAIENSLDGYYSKGISWRAKTLTDRGPGSQESKYGADFMGVLKIDLPELTVAKGFLAQAKLLRHGRVDDLSELQAQCEKMLRMSPDSYVFLYSTKEVRIVPAISIVGVSVDPTELYSRSPQRFFEDYLECFIGDRDINSPSEANLRTLMDEYKTRAGIFIGAKDYEI